MKKFDKVVILIPAYQPDSKLLKLIEELKRNTFYRIVVVDDGSDQHCKYIFDKIVEMGFPVVHHEKNMGKGKALKTGFKYIKENYEKYSGIITVDCDGQHSVWDVKTIAIALAKNKSSFILGVRDFKNPDVPTKSKFGNFFSKGLFNAITGLDLRDTQTGLRGIPDEMIPNVENVQGEGFEYEMNVLFKIYQEGIEIIQVPIMTTYYDKNKNSHFKSVKDGLNLTKTLFKNLFKKK